ncbi:hypothetical protein AGABI1DRAFT_134966 [Agaricus bisporus var. burnettii JB137-S8]|uniref:Uncharacterized protein n=1 Tax=Agaricus bisporus var. burnettii (strain JB137-S8 / ATCC MYA-4627 / FGSC 10392) TaxID=597362 RepID=K5XG47_AGABU|nr:uncharacterized protein AGABI1DRAFT_134966 [Agaricus bisporus var. burnettii JB137-S8]EKM73360.1 hypothetical protein AGABI1DRAFT_134966 [Agaricus bisporus var. burnettii JB137-S8]
MEDYIERLEIVAIYNWASRGLRYEPVNSSEILVARNGRRHYLVREDLSPVPT